MTFISKHGAYLRGAMLAVADGLIPIGNAQLLTGRVTLADVVSGCLVSITSYAAFANKNNAEFGPTVQTFIVGVVFVVFTVAGSLQGWVLQHRAVTFGVIWSMVLPAILTVIRQYMDKSLSLATLLTPDAAQAMLMLPAKVPGKLAQTVARAKAAAAVFKGDGTTDEPQPAAGAATNG